VTAAPAPVAPVSGQGAGAAPAAVAPRAPSFDLPATRP
jgi:hypothetical protein